MGDPSGVICTPPQLLQGAEAAGRMGHCTSFYAIPALFWTFQKNCVGYAMRSHMVFNLFGDINSSPTNRNMSVYQWLCLRVRTSPYPTRAVPAGVVCVCRCTHIQHVPVYRRACVHAHLYFPLCFYYKNNTRIHCFCHRHNQ